MRKTKTDKMREALAKEPPLEIKDDEIWTYQIEGLQKPRIVDKSIKLKTKISIVVFLVIAVILSLLFSIYALRNDEFSYDKLENGYEFVKYSNPGSVTEVTVDFVDGDKTKPITAIREYAFNCDEKIKSITVGRDVETIDGKSFYSCWSLETVFVDDENPYYCDIDGVLYNKALTEIIYYPSAHNLYLTRQAGYTLDFPENGSITNDDFCNAVKLIGRCLDEGEDIAKLTGDDAALVKKFDTLTGKADYAAFIRDYRAAAGDYVVPSTVTQIGKLAFAYSDVERVFLPQGLKTIGTLGFFKAEKLKEIYSYTASEAVADTVYGNVAGKLKTYASLPDGLEAIGSDAFTYDRGLTYMFVPKSVTRIDHHAFFNMAYKSGDVIEGVERVNVEADEESFKANTVTGASWLPTVDAGLFEKDVEVVYASAREQAALTPAPVTAAK